jgi:hypothetical protein
VKREGAKRRTRNERGTALLIALFALLLIGVVAIALIVASGTESALSGNYRSATSAYYAALAGLEEGRGRLDPKSPDFLNAVSPVQLSDVYYILNPGPSETNATVNPLTGSYPDNEYGNEFTPATLAGRTLHFINSVSGAAGIPGPSYKWVRINALTEQALGYDVDSSGPPLDNTNLIYYDPAHLDSGGNPKPSLISAASPPPTAVQALEVTALAALPNGGQRLLQYVVAPGSLNFVAPNAAANFPAALTLAGDNVQIFSVPTAISFSINGNDHDTLGSCNPGGISTTGVGFTNSTDTSYSTINSAITAAGHTNQYLGAGPASPNVNYVGPAPAPAAYVSPLAPNLTTVGGLNALVQQIKENADVYIGHDADTNDPLWPNSLTMSASHPMTIVVDGDFSTNAWHNTGYGLLLVTGQLTYDPDSSWDGIVLVIGKGIFESHQAGSGEIDGGVMVARLFDSGNNPLPPSSAPQSPTFHQISGGNGIYYSSCWVRAVTPSASYQVLSFKEISQ